MLNVPKSMVQISATFGTEGQDFDTVVKGYNVSIIGLPQYNVDVPGNTITLAQVDAAITTLGKQIMEDYTKLGSLFTSGAGKL